MDLKIRSFAILDASISEGLTEICVGLWLSFKELFSLTTPIIAVTMGPSLNGSRLQSFSMDPSRSDRVEAAVGQCGIQADTILAVMDSLTTTHWPTSNDLHSFLTYRRAKQN